MKNFIVKPVWALILTLSTAFLSFDERPGGENFVIYLNDKLVIQHYVGFDKDLKLLNLSNASASDIIKIHYNHCGKIGMRRKLTVTDAEKQKLKEWTFDNVQENSSPYMTLKVKDISSLSKDDQALTLKYSSQELPDGKLLVRVSLGSNARAALD